MKAFIRLCWFKGKGKILSPNSFLISISGNLHSSISYSTLPTSKPFNSFPQNPSSLPGFIRTRVNNLDDALVMFNRMVRMRPLPSVVDFTQLLGSIVKMKHYSSCISLFKEMVLLGVPVDEFTLTTAINCFCRLNRIDLGYAILGTFFKLGLQPDLATFNSLLNGLILQDRFCDAQFLLYNLINDKLCKPDTVTYGTMIKGLCQIGKRDNAVALLKLMDECGCGTYKPKIVAYNSIIDSFCKERRIDDALNLLSEMVKRSISPNVVTYTILMQGLFHSGKCETARKLLLEMQAAGDTPTLYTYAILLDGLCKNGQISEALSLFRGLEASGINCDVTLYNILIGATCKSRNPDIAGDLFSGLLSKGLLPDVRKYTSMISGLCEQGLLQKAKELFVKMEDHGYPPNSFAHNIFLQAFLRRKDCNEAGILVKKMDRMGFSLDSLTVSMLLDVLSPDGQDSTLVKIIQKLRVKHKLDPCYRC